MFGLAVIIAMLLDPAGGDVAQQSAGRCGERFGDSVFETSAAAGPVLVYGSGLVPELTDRFAADFAELAIPLQAEMGGLDDDVAVCIFADGIPLDGQALGWPEGQRLHAVAFGEERLVVLSSYMIRVVPDAGRAGLLHVAMWQVSGGSYPQPFGTDVAGWYRNRIGDQVEIVHRQFVRLNIGLSEPWPPFQWAVGRMVEPLLWNPEFGYGGNGDFTNYAVATAGNTVLSNPLGSNLDTLDAGWRQLLWEESDPIPGGSKGWVTGLVLIILAVVAGIAMAWWGHATRKRLERELREAVARERRTAMPVPELVAVRPSDPVGKGRGDAGIGGGVSSAVGRKPDHGNRAPSLGNRRAPADNVPPPGESGDDLFRHPGFDEQS